MVIGKHSVHLAVQLGGLASKGLDQVRGDQAPRSVAAVDRHANLSGKPDLVPYVLQIRGNDIRRRDVAGALRKVAPVDQIVKPPDSVAVDRVGPDADLEPVVLGRIVAPGNHHASIAPEMKYGKVKQGRGNDPDVDHGNTAGAHAGSERIAVGIGARTAVPRQRYPLFPLATHQRSDAAP